MDTALHAMIASEIATKEDNQLAQPTFDDDLKFVCQQYDKLIAGDVTVEDVMDLDALDRIHQHMQSFKTSAASLRTSSLWILYMDLIDILRRFIKAERTGNWLLHLSTMKEMLPFFAACGHNSYAKSAYVYLQSMQNLEKSHQDVYHAFLEGHHVIRRSDRFWAGLSTDLVIEQTLMRSVKTTGGMTRGHGLGEAQRAQWLLSMPARVEVNSAMQELTNVNFHSSDQHKDTTNARVARNDDIVKILHFFTRAQSIQ